MKDPNGIAWKQNRDFENLLKRLNANSQDPTKDKTGATPIDGFQPPSVDNPVADAACIGSETEGRDDERNMEKERKRKKKKRLRDDGETAKTVEGTSKKRRRAESTAATSATEPVETCPSSSSSPTLGTIAFVIDCPHRSNP